jgi:hypothetical protein
MTKFAARTGVATAQTAGEIDKTLGRYGARQFVYGRDDDRRLAVVEFLMNGRRIRITLPIPDRNDREFTHTAARGYLREPAAAAESYEQAVRSRWRALLLIIKAKLEAVESKIMTMEDEFLPYTVLGDGRTVAEHIQPHIDAAIISGELPALLPGLGGPDAR